MDVTKPYEFIGFWALDVTKPYKFIWFGDIRSLGILGGPVHCDLRCMNSEPCPITTPLDPIKTLLKPY